MQVTLPLPEWTLMLYDDACPPGCCAALELAAPTELQVEFNYAPGSPGTLYAPNGDPGDPPEPDELEILSVRCAHALVLQADGILLTLPPGMDLSEWFTKEQCEALELDLLDALDDLRDDDV